MTGGRIEILREILERGEAGTQEEIARALKSRGDEVTQSTISRTLRKLGAIKATNDEGDTVYRLPSEPSLPAPVQASLGDLIQSIQSNDSIIVIRTPPGSASLVARHLDHHRPGKLLGTIAGDDTIFVAPASSKQIRQTIEQIRLSLSQ